MKTMFVASDNNAKKRFQKPNILRKTKPPPKPSICEDHESLSVKNLVSAPTVQEPKFTVFKQCLNNNTQPLQRLIEENNVDNKETSIGECYQIDGNLDTDSSLAVTCDVLTNNNEENVFETTINVESFLDNSEMEQLVTQADIENEFSSRVKQDWCLDFINNAQEIIIEDVDGSHLGRLRLASTAPAGSPAAAPVTSLAHAAASPVQNITLEYMNCTMNFKCSVPNCSKRFRSEAALNKHEVTHTKVAKVGNKVDKPVLIECPVKKVDLATGQEEPCGVRCGSKKDIVSHLNEAHNPDDAMYICAECNRRFYYAAGLRAHARSHLRQGAHDSPWACTWPGCSRTFRQPCRLREHMRAHTGDKPYPCTYPNCGWSFRTASKLLRHARRHTGERRHACEHCGRAFRRREHLRDHTARHHATRHACTHTGCQRKFMTVEGLRRHLAKTHNENLVVAPDTREPAAGALAHHSPHEHTYMVNLNSETLSAGALSKVETSTIDISPHIEAAARDGMTLKLETEKDLTLNSVADVKITSHAQSEVQMTSHPESELYPGSQIGTTLNPESEIEMTLHPESEVGITLHPESKVGMTLHSESEVGITLQPESEDVMTLHHESEIGMTVHSESEAGMTLQPESELCSSPRAARTHCTWPFPAPAPQVFEENANQEYELEDDITVEISERSETESHIYTIRSDLFLHGNVLNEDSEEMGAGGQADEEGPRGELQVVGADSLLDQQHIDLMQEELMYTDAAVDESSFRVFLLSGEELS